jgi:hypothetical protein
VGGCWSRTAWMRPAVVRRAVGTGADCVAEGGEELEEDGGGACLRMREDAAVGGGSSSGDDGLIRSEGVG